MSISSFIRRPITHFANKLLQKASIGLTTCVVHSRHHWTWDAERKLSTRTNSLSCSSDVLVRRTSTVSKSIQGNLQHAELTADKELQLQWDDGYVYRYPYVWLRDNCRCEMCYNPRIQVRQTSIEDLDIHIEPLSISVARDGNSCRVTWPDRHESEFEAQFLRKIEFREKQSVKSLRLWGSDLLSNMPSFRFGDILHDNHVLLEFMERLRDVGLVMLKDVPTEEGQVNLVSKRLSNVQLTSFGPVVKEENKRRPSDLAYLHQKRALHTDFRFYNYTPGIQLLHCIKQYTGPGGESTFADGFKAALQLQKEDPEAYHTLSSIYLDYTAVGTDFYKYHHKSSWKVIMTDRYGDISMVNFGDPYRDVTHMSKENIHAWYKAMKVFYNIMNSQHNLVKFRMKSGEMTVFDNTRVLHGRTEFNGDRRLEGCFLDWDDVYSRIRVIRQELGMPI